MRCPAVYIYCTWTRATLYNNLRVMEYWQCAGSTDMQCTSSTDSAPVDTHALWRKRSLLVDIK